MTAQAICAPNKFNSECYRKLTQKLIWMWNKLNYNLTWATGWAEKEEMWVKRVYAKEISVPMLFFLKLKASKCWMSCSVPEGWVSVSVLQRHRISEKRALQSSHDGKLSTGCKLWHCVYYRTSITDVTCQ